jgi:6,7-dimethyl-8-ribityllumazine synthase
MKIAVVVSRFNDDVTNGLLQGAMESLLENKVKEKNIKIIRVPGAFEIPLACQKLAMTKKYDGIIALGCIIKGETDHYYYISNEVSRGIMRIMLEYSIPIGFGVLTTTNLKEAKDRSGKKGNKGTEAAEAVLKMTEILG